MASLTTTEVLGFCTSVGQAMTTHKALLLTKKLDITDLKTELAAEQQTAVEADSAQETLKANLKVQTEATAAALDAAYASASTKLDAMIGAVGKTSELGKQLARLRSSIRRGPNPPPAPPAPNP